MKYTDPFGLYVFAEGTSDDEKKKFRQGLKDLQSARDSYKKGSDDYKRLDRAVKAYGKEGVDNGVTVKFATAETPGNTRVFINADNTGNKVTTSDNPTGQNIIVTIDPSQNKNGADYAFTVGHEGSHVADGSDLVGSFPKDLTTFAAQQALNGPLNLTTYATETRAYSAEVLVIRTLASQYNLGSVKVGGIEVWNVGWAAADMAAKSAAGIDRVLAQPKSSGGKYVVTSTNQGRKLID